MDLDERAQTLLTTLVHQYIVQGTPVGSSALSRQAGLSLSPATVRNVMVELEQLGLVMSPHTSAGRVPTPAGYRFFVDTVLTASAFSAQNPTERGGIAQTDGLAIDTDTPTRMANQAAQSLSQLSHFAGIIVVPQRSQVFGHIDFLSLSPKRVLVVMVTPEGDVQNRLLQLDAALSSAQLIAAANYLNTHFSGQPLTRIRAQLASELGHLQQDISTLMQQAMVQTETPTDDEDTLIVKGERHLLAVSELTTNMERLRQTFDLFDEKTRLLQLLEHTRTAGGVQVFIGGESDVLPFDGVSLISAPYRVNDQIVGTLGVIGPSRMAYDKVIPMVDITAKLLSRAMQNFS